MNGFSHVLSEFTSLTYASQGNIDIARRVESIDVAGASDYILNSIDKCRGALFSSSYEYPGRYTQWDIGFINPCLEIRSRGHDFTVIAFTARGYSLLTPVNQQLEGLKELEELSFAASTIRGRVRQSECFFVEEMRSRQPTIFSVIRAIKELLASPEDRFLGLYGAFGYDLVFQFEPMQLRLEREADQADLVLYLPDELVVVDHRMERAYHLDYSFPGIETGKGFIESTNVQDNKGETKPLPEHQYGRYAGIARRALGYFARGDLFEVVPSQTIYEHCSTPPSRVFQSLQGINPSPYGFIINLGSEFLVGASPEMYVRVEGRRVETCPISGTIKRGRDAIEDSERIRELLNSFKDEAELTMCTDVDRNDKSRVCEPGSVKVIGRRQIEMYSHLIHTVDHVEGILRPEFDSLDAFLTHMWAVTVTGAPKRAAIRWLEENEDSSRGWYGGAVGFLSFNGDLNTGLTLRTIRIKNGVAQVRVGATLLYDSIPENEEAETYLKAAAMMKALQASKKEASLSDLHQVKTGEGKKILLVDHEDSFVHTLANYFRQTGAQVEVLRGPLARRVLADGGAYDLVILSPGPGRPDEFALSETIELCIDKSLPIFGVCLGLQGLVEYFGGSLGQLDYPQHGKTSQVKVCGEGPIWQGLPAEFTVGRYHSLYTSLLPECLKVSAISEDGVVMAIEHVDLPVAAVQFHPESIMTAGDNNGLHLVSNVMNCLVGK